MLRNDKPPTARDKKVRLVHEKDSVKFNLRHAQDHVKEANLHAVKLKKNAPKKAMGTFKIVKKK